MQLTFCDQCRAQLIWGRSPNKGPLSRGLGSHGVSHRNTASPRWGLWESHHLLVSKRCLLRLSQLKAGEGRFWVSTCVHFPGVDTLSLGCLSLLFLSVSKATCNAKGTGLPAGKPASRMHWTARAGLPPVPSETVARAWPQGCVRPLGREGHIPKGSHAGRTHPSIKKTMF